MGEGKTNFSITPPLSKRYFRREIFANDFATAIIQYVLGPRPILSWVSSNVATARGVGRQAVHSDAYTDILPLPVCVELNTYLQDITVDNGSTELWPGTQNTTEDDLVPHGRGWIKPALFNKRARTDPPIRPDLPKGTIVMRDLRLWHAGSKLPRTVAAFCSLKVEAVTDYRCYSAKLHRRPAHHGRHPLLRAVVPTAHEVQPARGNEKSCRDLGPR